MENSNRHAKGGRCQGRILAMAGRSQPVKERKLRATMGVWLGVPPRFGHGKATEHRAERYMRMNEQANSIPSLSASSP
jgi:hypothetical protein